MYYNIYYDRNTKIIHLWDDKKGYLSFKNEYSCYKKVNYPTKTKSLYGDNVIKVRLPSRFDRSRYETYFESDIYTEIKTLVELYYDSDEISSVQNILIFDIEVSSKGGFPDINFGDKEILSIAIRDVTNKTTHVFFSDPKNRFTLQDSDDTKFVICKNEAELLRRFIFFVRKSKCNILVSYNGDYFDVKYIINRGQKIIGKDILKLSPVDIIDLTHKGLYKIAGINHMDYLRLYQKYAEGSRESWSLDSISDLEIKESKKKYEGTLDNLHDTSLDDFILYNIQDVLLVEKLENKLNYLQIAINMCHKGHIPYEDIYNQSWIIDGALLCLMKRKGLVSPDRPEEQVQTSKQTLGKILNWKELKELIDVQEIEKDREYEITISDALPDDYEIRVQKDDAIVSNPIRVWKKILSEYNIKISSSGNIYILPSVAKGAYVKQPILGRYGLFIDLDYSSEYPSLIRSLNISPETYLFKVENWDQHIDDFIKYRNTNENGDKSITYLFKNKSSEPKTSTIKNLSDYLDRNKYCISANGCIFAQDKRGIIPELLDTWTKERKEYEALSKKYYNEGNQQSGKAYEIKQYILKILLNSVYGVIVLRSFRFYNKDLAEAITLGGQALIKYSEREVNRFLNNKTGIKKDRIPAIDTDSLIISLSDVCKEVDEIKSIAHELQSFINERVDTFAKETMALKSHYFNMKQEMIGDGAIFAGKKRYILHIIEKKGVTKDEYEIKGINAVRSDFPKFLRVELKSFLKEILANKTKEEIDSHIKNTRSELEKKDIYEVGVPVGVHGLDKYYDPIKRYKLGTPAHVKAAINYNIYLKNFGLDSKYEPIREGEKIKHVPLKHNVHDFERMAFKDGSPQDIIDYIKKYIDYDELWRGTMSNKLDTIYEAIGWKEKEIKKVREKKKVVQTIFEDFI